jgi:hypothetical protein
MPELLRRFRNLKAIAMTAGTLAKKLKSLGLSEQIILPAKFRKRTA